MLELAEQGDNETQRAVFGEYHGPGAVTGEFMVRQGKWKYIHYEGMRPQLFNLEDDPGELQDLGGDPAYEEVCDQLNQILRQEFGDLTALDARIKAYQRKQFEVWWQTGSLKEKTDELLQFAGRNKEAITAYLKQPGVE